MTVRVLMVDDDIVHLELSERFLTRQNPDYEITSVENSQEAISLLSEQEFDATVCDIDLADDKMSGLDILDYIRKKGHDTPVIIFTGKSREEFAIQALNLGADYYIRKSSTNIDDLYAELSYYIQTAVQKRKIEKALRESERKLRLSEARLAEAQRISHSGSWVWEIRENREIWSDEIYRIFGLEPQEFQATYEAFLQSVHPEDRESVEEAVKSAIHDRTPYRIDHRIVRPDGSVRYVHEEGEVTFDDDGTAIQMIGTIQDITAQKNQEALLREERDKAQLYLDLAGTIIFALDTSLNVTMINRKGCELLGCEENDILGKNWIELFVIEEQREKVEDHLRRVLRKEETNEQGCNFQILNALGEQKNIIFYDTVLYDEESNVRKILCSAQIIEDFMQSNELSTKISQSTTKHEGWWQGVFEHAPTAIGIFDAEGRLIDCNKAAVNLLGVNTREDLLGLDLFRESRLPEEALESVSKGEIHRFRYKWDFVYVREKGILKTTRSDVVYMDVVLSPLQNSFGQTLGYVLHANDITERERTEAALKANEEMFRTIFEEAPICIQLFDSEGMLIRTNKASLELFGHEHLEDAVGVNLFDDPNIPDFVKEKLQQGNSITAKIRFDFSKIQVHELYRTSKTGVMHLDCVFSPLHYGKDENLQGYIVHVQDITDHYLAEQALMESRESYRELYNNALIGLFRVRISDGMILECNNQFANSFGFTNRRDIIDSSCFFKDFLTSSQSWTGLKESLKDMDNLMTDLPVITKNNQQLWMRFSLRLCQEKGYIEGVMSDITQEKYALEMLRKQREELSEFAHSMSHDLKNIFHNMNGFIELVEDENDFSHLQRLRQMLKESGELLDHSVALADAGLTVEESLTVIDLDSLVQFVAKSTIPESISFHQDKLPKVKGDEMKVAQIFRNLLDNAVRHGQPTQIEVRLEDKQDRYCILISNDGKEIEGTIRTQLFGKGFTSKKSGQGYGLTIVKRIVEAHNWQIELATSYTTTFKLLIPK
ncbi:PAS domain S-box protein [Candidatus Thorarchaeota archaeon]|nr:MAG: PAS domain S-box protein [Candidatus Thorarchaeota archaeon]